MEPTRSLKTIVSWRRSLSVEPLNAESPVLGPRGVPQFGQKRAVAPGVSPHCGQEQGDSPRTSVTTGSESEPSMIVGLHLLLGLHSLDCANR